VRPVAGQLAEETAGAIAPNRRSEHQSSTGTKPPTDRCLQAVECAVEGQSVILAAGDTTPARRRAAAAELSAGQAVATSASAAASTTRPIVTPNSVADASEILTRTEPPPPSAAAGPVAGRPRRQHHTPKQYCCSVTMDNHHYCLTCNYRYRTRGSCYKHTVKVHGQLHVPGQPLKDIPAEELEVLRETYRSCSGIIEAGLWECKIGWSPVVPATPVAVGDECSSTISVQRESV